MTAFSFNAKAALEFARKCRTRPNVPNLPNRGGDEGAGLGGFGRLGRVHDFSREMTPDDLAREIFEERAAIREYDGGQDRDEAECAALAEAMRATGITPLDEWRREADDPHNPDNWK